jgi:RNA polymerase sigma factor for flagellar operon FliA
MNDKETNEFIEENLPLIVSIAKTITKDQKYTSELIEVGKFAVILAHRNFDPSKKVKFTTFAYKKIRGEMIDYLRKCEWFNKADRKKGVNSMQYIEDFTEDVQEIVLNHTTDCVSVEDIVSKREIAARLIEALDCLTQQEREVIELHYFKDLTLKKISLMVGVSEQMISNTHILAKEKIKAYIENEQDNGN